MYANFVPAENRRAVPDTDGRVEVSDFGRVRRRTIDDMGLVRR
jgi:hypothetical protein